MISHVHYTEREDATIMRCEGHTYLRLSNDSGSSIHRYSRYHLSSASLKGREDFLVENIYFDVVAVRHVVN